MPSDTEAKAAFHFYSAKGRLILRDILQDQLPFHPHDYSIDVIAKILDREDCLVRTATASGKTGIIAMLALVTGSLGRHPQMASDYARWFDRDPLILVICPTRYLEHNIVS